jgi:hypothetical protein
MYRLNPYTSSSSLSPPVATAHYRAVLQVAHACLYAKMRNVEQVYINVEQVYIRGYTDTYKLIALHRNVWPDYLHVTLVTVRQINS